MDDEAPTHAVVDTDNGPIVKRLVSVPHGAVVLHEGNVKECRTFLVRHRERKKKGVDRA